jgi:hypothetical protein
LVKPETEFATQAATVAVNMRGDIASERWAGSRRRLKFGVVTARLAIPAPVLGLVAIAGGWSTDTGTKALTTLLVVAGIAAAGCGGLALRRLHGDDDSSARRLTLICLGCLLIGLGAAVAILDKVSVAANAPGPDAYSGAVWSLHLPTNEEFGELAMCFVFAIPAIVGAVAFEGASRRLGAHSEQRPQQ